MSVEGYQGLYDLGKKMDAGIKVATAMYINLKDQSVANPQDIVSTSTGKYSESIGTKSSTAKIEATLSPYILKRVI